MKYEKSLRQINEDKKRLSQLLAELKVLIEMLLNYIAAKEDNIRKGVADMGGRVLIFPHDYVYDAGIAEGENRGENRGKTETKREVAFSMFDDGFYTIFIPHSLRFIKFSINSPHLHQLLMAPVFHNPAVFEYQNMVRDCRKS